MKTFSTLLISTAASVIANSVDAKSIDTSCLNMSVETVGSESPNQFFTNKTQLALDKTDDAMRLFSFTTCVGSDQSINGIQFVLSSSEYSDPNAVKFELDPIGQMTGDCNEMMIAGPLTSIRASYTEGMGLRGISYYRGQAKKTYGVVGDNYTEWLITEVEPLVGLYGTYSDAGVQKLGLITLDLGCQADIVDVVQKKEELDPVELVEAITENTEEAVVNEQV